MLLPGWIKKVNKVKNNGFNELCFSPCSPGCQSQRWSWNCGERSWSTLASSSITLRLTSSTSCYSSSLTFPNFSHFASLDILCTTSTQISLHTLQFLQRAQLGFRRTESSETKRTRSHFTPLLSVCHFIKLTFCPFLLKLTVISNPSSVFGKVSAKSVCKFVCAAFTGECAASALSQNNLMQL